MLVVEMKNCQHTKLLTIDRSDGKEKVTMRGQGEG